MNLENFPHLQTEIKIRPGLTLVKCETLGKYFIRESLEPMENLPVSVRREIKAFLRGDSHETEK